MAADRPRLHWLDLARTAALAAMAVYHFGYDLEAFGRLPPGTMVSGFWYHYARAVAGSFLFMVGLSLWLAHGTGIRWRPFLVRLAQIAAGAALVTVGTRIVQGPYYVFFGILHSIAVSSLVGLIFLRLPAPLTLLTAAAAFAAPTYLRSELFDAPWLLWTGLSVQPVQAVDFVPTLPWLGPVLAGLGVAKLAGGRLRSGGAPGRAVRALSWPGRHSLMVYLVHQPLLIGLVWALAQAGLI